MKSRLPIWITMIALGLALICVPAIAHGAPAGAAHRKCPKGTHPARHHVCVRVKTVSPAPTTLGAPTTPTTTTTPAPAPVATPEPALAPTEPPYGPAVAALRTTSQTIPNAVWTPIEMNGVRFDTDGAWSAATPTRLVAPVSGVYEAGATLSITGNANGQRVMRMMKGKGSGEPTENLGELLVPGQAAVGVGAGGNALSIGSRPFTLNAGEWIRIDIYQTSGVPLAVMGDGVHTVEFGMSWQRPLP